MSLAALLIRAPKRSGAVFGGQLTVWKGLFQPTILILLLKNMNRKIGIYHGRPTSIVRSEIDVDLPRSPDANNLNDNSFDSSGLLESIHLTGQAELFLQEM